MDKKVKDFLWDLPYGEGGYTIPEDIFLKFIEEIREEARKEK